MFRFGLLLKFGALAAVFALGFGAAWKWQGARLDSTKANWRAERKAYEQAVAEERLRQATITEKVVTQYRDRVVRVQGATKEVIREVPILVPAEADAGCVVPVGFVRLCNAAAACGGPAPEPSPGADGAPSGVALSAVAAWAVTVEGQYCQVATQLESLQEWNRLQTGAK